VKPACGGETRVQGSCPLLVVLVRALR
jgi:hypothetical protein